MGIDFIHRTLKTTGLVLVLALMVIMYYVGFYHALSFFFGGVWGMINMIFITALVRVVLRPEGADVRRMILLGLIKFPLLYVAGYFLLSYPAFVAMYTVIGSGAVFAILLLKALGRMITGLDESGKDKANLRGVL